MIQELGIMLFNEREKMSERQKSVADGIVSISEMSKVESGKKAMKLLDEIEAKLDMTKSVNRQFIGTGYITSQTAKGELTREQANEQPRELLHLTMPPVASGTMIYRVPFRMEYAIWNHMAINFRKAQKVEEALIIYEALMQRYNIILWQIQQETGYQSCICVHPGNMSYLLIGIKRWNGFMHFSQTHGNIIYYEMEK